MLNFKMIGGILMKRESKKIFSTMFALFLFVCSIFATFVFMTPAVSADLGSGEVISYKPDVASTGTDVTLKIQFRNDATDPENCIDELIIMPPDEFGHTGNGALVTKFDRSTFSQSNEETNDDINLVEDNESVRIVPDHSICPGETVNIWVSNLVAPSSYKTGGYDIVIKTSDKVHNDIGNSKTWQAIDQNEFPVIYATQATQLKLEYLHIDSFSDSGFSATAWGASARLDHLYVQGTNGASIDVKIMTNNGWHSILPAGTTLGSGVTDLVMDYTNWVPATMDTSDLESGYVRDGASVNYQIVLGAGSLVLRGSDTEIRNDPKWSASGLLTARGTIITAGTSTAREVVVQTVDDDGYDVNNEQIPVTAETTLGTIVTPEPYMTDTDGNVYFSLEPNCDFGVADVTIGTDPLATTPSVTEKVGINAGSAESYLVTEGPDEYVPAGESQLIEVQLFDSCDNLITNTNQEFVVFNYSTDDCGDINKLSQAPNGQSHQHEEEFSNMGLAQVWLNTDCQLCEHEVDIKIGSLGTENIFMHGTPNTPTQMKVTIPEDEIEAQMCVNATVEVTDACGNRVDEIYYGDDIQQWESIVRVTVEDALPVDQPGWAASSQTYIADSDFREADIYNGGAQPFIQGKLNNGIGTVEICGCQGLGVFDVKAESDTLEDGLDTVNVVNAPNDCIETTFLDAEDKPLDQLLACEKYAHLDVAVKDICGNYVINQECQQGEANYCVDLSLGGTCGGDAAYLSTETVCVDIGTGGPGHLETPVEVFRTTNECCQLDIQAAKGIGCCGINEDLPQCEVSSLLFHGLPDHMTTELYQTRTDPITQERHILDQIPQDGDETVSEEAVDIFTVYDACGHVVKDFDGTVDVELNGEDCESIIEVDSNIPLGEDGSNIPSDGDINKCLLNKVVIDNCHDETVKQWLPLEFNDIVVDKLAYKLNDTPADAWVYVYLENENEPGLQIGQDPLVAKAPVQNLNQIVMELKDARLKPRLFDDQREGGVVVRAGDSRDFYAVLVSPRELSCEDYNLDYMYYQDYNSPDITDFGAGYPFGSPQIGFVRDSCVGSDNFNWIENMAAGGPACPGPNLQGTQDSRNDDYNQSTPDYGFGDRVLHQLQFREGQAWMTFRDLVAEKVNVVVKDVFSSGSVCTGKIVNDVEMVPGYFEAIGVENVTPQPETVNFQPQLATQIKLVNHDVGEHKVATCEEDTFDPDRNAWHFNIQTTDGFDNPHPKEVEVQMDYCLKAPFGSQGFEQMILGWCTMKEHCSPGFCSIEECEQLWMDEDHCYTREEFKDFIAQNTEIGQYMGGVLFDDLLGEELSEWIDKYFDEAEVKFWIKNPAGPGYLPLTDGKLMTDTNGQAEVWATGKKAGLFKITAKPVALDGASAMVSFDAGTARTLDIAAVPSFGVPADGEEEAILLLRALDECGNIVQDSIPDVTVVAEGEQGKNQVTISQDFDGLNNYDQSVTGNLIGNSILGLTKLAVLDDIPETATITAECGNNGCGGLGLTSDTTTVAFQGAPRKLVITDIEPSDRLPADGITGAWVTIQVQDVNGNRVTGYLGDGFQGDPGDPFGFTDFTFNNICIDLDDARADYPMGMRMGKLFPWEMDIDDATFGWTNLNGGLSQYCGDLMFGEGKVYVVLDADKCNGGATVQVKVMDQQPWQGQEMNENGLPNSVHPTQLDPAMGEVKFVDPATEWIITVDQTVVPADGQTPITVDVQVRNPYMDVRQAVEGTLFVGGTSESGAKVSWKGEFDPLNPTSAGFVTDPLTGRATLEVTSDEEGMAELTVTGGSAWVCYKKKPLGYVCPECNDKIFLGYDCHYNRNVDLQPMNIQVQFTQDYTNVGLDEGWNLISLPWILNDSDINVATAGITGNLEAIWYFDADSQTWLYYDGPGGAPDTLTTLEPGKGYWVDMSAADTLYLMGSFLGPDPLALPPTYSVKTGWNLIGFHSEEVQTADTYLKNLNGDWSSLYEFVNGGYNKVLPGDNMNPGRGYWLYVSADGEIAV